RLRQWTQAESERRQGARAGARRWLYPALVLASITAIAAFAVMRLLPRDDLVALTSADRASDQASSVAAVEADTAIWRAVVEEAVENIDLSDGTLRLHVKRPPGGRRVIVRVPDGEIEDLGTIFHVVVREGRTASVGVDEGRVTIRIHGLAPLTIS